MSKCVNGQPADMPCMGRMRYHLSVWGHSAQVSSPERLVSQPYTISVRACLSIYNIGAVL